MSAWPTHAFSNGTEERAWQSCWCEHCARDHDIHARLEGDGPGCETYLGFLVQPNCSEGWPESWLPEPDDGQFSLPSRLVCLEFTPCDKCGGDPLAGERATRIDEVRTYWEARP